MLSRKQWKDLWDEYDRWSRNKWTFIVTYKMERKIERLVNKHSKRTKRKK